jgi:hypothetical protein
MRKIVDWYEVYLGVDQWTVFGGWNGGTSQATRQCGARNHKAQESKAKKEASLRRKTETARDQRHKWSIESKGHGEGIRLVTQTGETAQDARYARSEE